MLGSLAQHQDFATHWPLGRGQGGIGAYRKASRKVVAADRQRAVKLELVDYTLGIAQEDHDLLVVEEPCTPPLAVR